MATPLSEERIAEMREFWDGHEDGDTSDDRAVWRFVHHASLDLLDEVERLRSLERDHLYGLRTEVARLRARVAALEGVLRSVEWAARDADDDGKPIETCPACRWWKTQGHHPQCDLDAALRGAGE